MNFRFIKFSAYYQPRYNKAYCEQKKLTSFFLRKRSQYWNGLLQVEQKNMDFFSLLIIQDLTSAHSGEYTCRATNDFGTVSHSASLIVKGIYCLTSKFTLSCNNRALL